MDRKKSLHSYLLGTTLTLGLAANSFGQESQSLANQSLNSSSMLILKVDSSQLAIPESIKQLGIEERDKPIATLVETSQRNISSLQELTKGQIVYVSVDMPYTSALHLHAIAPKSVPASDLEKIAKYLAPDFATTDQSTAEWTKLDIGTNMGLKPKGGGGTISPEQTAKWQAALEATKEFPVQVAILLPDYVLKTFDEIKPELPAAMGGGSADWLLDGANWISVGIDTKKVTAQIVIQSGSEESAKTFSKNLPKLLRSVVTKTAPDKESTLALSVLLGMIKPERLGDRVVVSLADDESNQAILQLGAKLASSVMAPISANSTSNRLKQFALGFHNYESAYQAFPTYLNMTKTKMKSGLSWRVHILPFIGFAELYQEFKLDESWDSPHNIKLLSKMPSIYSPIADVNETVELKPNHTTFVAPVGSKTVFGQDEPMQFRNITDGTSNTIAFVELKREHAIPWTSPEEYPFDEANPTAKLRSYNGTTVVALFDGAAINLKIDLPKETWLALFSRNGGEVVNLD